MTLPVKTTAIYSLHNVCLRYGHQVVLKNLTLEIDPGEQVAIIGASGAGKSSFLNLLNGACLPSQGDLWVLGHQRTELKGRQLRKFQTQIGTIYQQFHLVNDMRVVHNVNAGHLARWPLWKALLSLLWPLDLDLAIAALTQVGIPEHLFSRTNTLSGGQQQRVAIARVLVQDPMIILADEPVASLDPRMSDKILQLLIAISGKRAKTLVMSLHDVELATKYCSRIIGLKQGSVLFDCHQSELSSAMLTELYATH